MARADLTRPLGKVTFHCTCTALLTLDEKPGPGWTFDATPLRVDDDPGQLHHPYRYFARCQVCGSEAEQASWERALLKAWSSATGPTSTEGKAAAAKNLEGHPTPAEAKLTRFNALKHGLNARVATYFPAKPDGYAFCKGCEVERDWCRRQPACTKKTELFMLHQAAFEQNDPKRLNGVYSDLHASILAMLQQILQQIIGEGVTLVSPKFAIQDGAVIIARYLDAKGDEHVINEVQAHPLFKPLGELISRCNLSLSDMGMTAREVTRDEDEELGFIKAPAGGAGGGSIEDFARKQADNIAALRGHLDRSRSQRDRDPVLIEHRQQNGGEDQG